MQSTNAPSQMICASGVLPGTSPQRQARAQAEPVRGRRRESLFGGLGQIERWDIVRRGPIA